MESRTVPDQAHPTLGTAALERVKRVGETQTVTLDEILVQQGDPMDKFIVVLEGEIAVEQRARAGLQHVATHGPGQFFGDVHSLRVALAWYKVASAKRGSFTS